MRHEALIRFWALDHHRPEAYFPPPSAWATLIYAGRGTLTFATEDRRWVLPPTRAFLLAPHGECQIRTLAPMQVRSLYFAPDFIPKRETGPLSVSPLLRELILAACARGPLVARRPELRAMADLIQSEVTESPRYEGELPWPRSEWLRQLATSAFETAIPLNTLAAKTGYSRRTVERAMVAETGLALGSWYRQARMARSQIRLAEGASISEAAIVAGYSEPSAYIQAFRRLYHLTPGQYKESGQ